MMVYFVLFLFVAVLAVRSDAFSMQMSTADCRRAFLAKVAATTAAVTAGVVVPSPALAVGGKNKVNTKLLSFVTYPNNDVNGEDGTVQAGEYGKGDSATFFVYEDAGNVKNLASQPKEFFEKALIKAISQKGDNMYQNFKITNMAPQKGEYRDQEYVVVDFKYELLTGAGFEVDRRGIASVTSEGNAVEVMWAATTRQRYKKLEPTLRSIAGSFRCYTDGLNFSEELVA
ncbi:hypothetical protein MHU86_11406 [Fragilaria crotonensis]|nr:hypothetical protein MHU86_11406 [Fragilaria crotonensis]